jgi:hypothetical protein
VRRTIVERHIPILNVKRAMDLMEDVTQRKCNLTLVRVHRKRLALCKCSRNAEMQEQQSSELRPQVASAQTQ